jgi:hypothetical protein
LTDARSSEVLWNITEHYDEADSSISHSDFQHFGYNKNEPDKTYEKYKCGKDKLSDPYAKYYSPVKHSAAEPLVLVRG